MKLPTKNQWRQFFKILSKKEKLIFFGCLVLFVVSFSFILIDFYLKNTQPQAAQGGEYIEGVVGFPRWINPIFAPSNEADQDLTELIFSGLMKYDENSKIIPDISSKYEILDEGKIYEFYLKENVLWSDSQPLTAEDVIFTIKTIQNPDIKSPLRASWLGVEVEKISDLGVRFILKNPSLPFLENTTLKIIPKHIWENVLPQNFPLSFYNLKPVGSGPYKLKKIAQDEEGKIISLDLIRNPIYYGRAPNLQQISFQFFDSEENLVKAAGEGKIDGFSLATNLTRKGNVKLEKFNLYSLSLPRYFSVFFNQNPPAGKSKIFAEKEVRLALNYGTNKEELLREVQLWRGKVVDSPILPEIYGFNPPLKIYQFDLEGAKLLLEEAGFKEGENGMRVKIIKKTPEFQFKSNLAVGVQGQEVKELQKCLAKDKEIYPEGEVTGYFGTKTKVAVIKFQEKYRADILIPAELEKGTGEVKSLTRKKLNEICFETGEEKIPLKFSLITVEQPLLVEVASQLKSQWQTLGIPIDIQTFDISTLEREILRPRNFEALLFGEVLGGIPDPFPFWHSSQKKDPGLNLAGYQNKDCDKLLEEARESLDEAVRKEKLEKFQDCLIGDAPALFLFTPDYLYFTSKEIKGIKTKIITDPSKRFTGIENWYIKTKRVWQ